MTKEYKEALDRWYNKNEAPDELCKRCTPNDYWESNNCSNCPYEPRRTANE